MGTLSAMGNPYNAAGNAAAADSAAALSFTSMEMMVHSMAAVKRTEKREALLMVWFLSEKELFKKVLS